MLAVEIIMGIGLIAWSIRMGWRARRIQRQEAERARRITKALLPHLKAAAERGKA